MADPTRTGESALHPETTTQDYRDAIGGRGPLSSEWRDKPHRLIYDLCNEVERLAALVAEWVEIHPNECRYDHDDACQAHYLHERPCLVERSKNASTERGDP